MIHFRLLLISVALLLTAPVFSQCQITTNASLTEITCGTCVTLNAFGNGTGNIAFQEDFNSGAPVGWQFTQSAQFNNPCSPGGVDGTSHLWMGPASPNPRTMATTPLDLSLGGYICFDMLFAAQGGNSPCEGPDEPNEGVYLQYSIDNGANWVTINYFNPNGGNDNQLTNWNNWCFTLPPAAVTASTMIRWHQDNVTSAEYDHWGIDNVEITLNDPNFGITWEHDGYAYGLGVPGGNNPTPVCPQETTTYTANVSDGVTTCTSSITITVVDPVIIMTAGTDQQLCAGDCVDIDGDAYHLVSPASTPTFANNEFALVAGGSASVNINIQGLNTQQLVNGSITEICIAGFNVVGGVSACLSFGGCPCNGGTIGFGQTCDVNTGSFEVILTTPGGCEITLVPAGSSSGAYNNTCFVPSGGTIIGGGFPGGGPWSPSTSIDDLNGCDANGVWTLTFEGPGGVSLGVGTLNGWSISFDDPEITEPVDFVWSPTTNMSGEDTFSPNVCPDVTTTYTLAATDLAGCLTVTDEVTITVENCCVLEIIDLVSVEPGCNTDDGEITITELEGELGTVTYALDSGTPQASPTFSDLAPGSYVVTVNDDNNCPVSVQVELAAADGPVLTGIAITAPSCGSDDGELSVTATGTGLEYSFDGGLTFGSDGNATGLSAADYLVVVMDDTGCSVDSLVTLNPADGPTITDVEGTDPLCGGEDGSITITASLDAISFSIDGGATTQTTGLFTDLPADSYDIEIADAGGCTATSTIVLANAILPVITDVETNDPLCGATDGSIIVSATPSTVQFSLDGGITLQSTGTFTDLAQGSYTVQVVDLQGCTSTQEVVLATADGPEITDIVQVEASCGTADGSITVSATGTDLTYSMDGGVSYVPDAEFTGVASGAYTIVVQDDVGCTTSGTITVSEEAGPVIVDITVNATTCGQDDGSIAVNATGPDLTYSIDGGTTFQSSNSFTGLAEGGYDVVVLSSACTATETVTVDDSPGPSITNVAVQAPSCAGSDDATITITGQGNTPFTYALDGGTPQSSSTFTAIGAGNYSVSIIEAGGCTAAQDVTITDPATLTLALQVVDPNCSGDCNGSASAVAAGGTGAYTYVWSANIPAGTLAQADLLCPGNYSLQLSDANGCQVDTAFSLIDPLPFLIDTVIVTSETCPELCDGTILVQADAGVLYSLNGGVPQAAALFQNVCPGSYTISAANASGCITQSAALVLPGEALEASFTPTPRSTNIFTPRFVFNNNSVGATSYVWNFGGFGNSTETSPGFEFAEEPGEIEVCLTATNTSGCVDIFCTTIFIEADNTVFVPNTFTPDGDGINDTFHAFGEVALAQNFLMLIHNRWGEEIYSTKDMFQGWDGTSAGEPCQDGVYIWTVDVQDPKTAEIKRYRGHVTLLR